MSKAPVTLGGPRAKIVGALILGSSSLVAFLHQWEDPKKPETARVVYADKLAGGLPTACGGVTKHVTDESIVVGDVWSQERCDWVLQKVLAQGQVRLAECFDVKLTQNQFDAFSSHAHNFGTGATCASRAVGLTNAGKKEEGCRALAFTPEGAPNWSFVGTTFYKGLHNRRKAEMEMCLK